MLAQLSETLAIAPSALGSTCRLTAKRGGRPFRRAPITSLASGSGSPVIRGGRDHMTLGFMILYLPNQTLRFEPCHLVSLGRPARDRLCTAPQWTRRRPYSRRQLLANAAIAASRVGS